MAGLQTHYDKFGKRKSEIGGTDRMKATDSKQAPPAGPDWPTIVAAHARIAHRIHRTPVLTCSSLDDKSGAQLFFKCDNFQKTGSFKICGANNAIFSISAPETARG